MIGDGDGLVAEALHPLQELRDADGAVEQRILGVDMQVNQVRRGGDGSAAGPAPMLT